MVYLNGKIAHKLDNTLMVEEIVQMVEARAAELDAARAVGPATAPAFQAAE